MFKSSRFKGQGLRALAALFALVPLVLSAGQDDIGKFDPRMVEGNAVIDTNGVKWIDGRYLPIEGRAFNDTDHYYDRLPANVTTNVNGGVRSMKHHTAGLQFRFTTGSRKLRFRWTVYNVGMLEMQHMPKTGVSGIDVYRQDGEGKWRFVRGACPAMSRKGDSFEFEMGWTPGRPCLVNLPLYNGIRAFSLGVDKDASVAALGPRKSGVDKPVVFYGTSITHGGCCSRPGLAFPSIVGRDLDVPIVNLGFSGSGVMEFEMSEHLARIDASCYVLDCLWNMGLAEDPKHPGRSVEGNYERFIRNLRAKRPGVPIVMAEQCDVFCNGPCPKDRFIRKLHEKLIAEGWTDLVYLPKDGMYTGDLEGTVDGCHPNDWGMMSMAGAFSKAVRTALRIKN